MNPFPAIWKTDDNGNEYFDEQAFDQTMAMFIGNLVDAPGRYAERMEAHDARSALKTIWQ